MYILKKRSSVPLKNEGASVFSQKKKKECDFENMCRVYDVCLKERSIRVFVF